MWDNGLIDHWFPVNTASDCPQTVQHCSSAEVWFSGVRLPASSLRLVIVKRMQGIYVLSGYMCTFVNFALVVELCTKQSLGEHTRGIFDS